MLQLQEGGIRDRLTVTATNHCPPKFDRLLCSFDSDGNAARRRLISSLHDIHDSISENSNSSKTQYSMTTMLIDSCIYIINWLAIINSFYLSLKLLIVTSLINYAIMIICG